MNIAPSACAVVLLGAVALAACSDAPSATTVKVTASDDACELESTDLAAGSTTFRVTNTGSKVTEVYIYAAGDRVVTERENIGPGTSADFNADLAAGSYEVACKPGQTGDGIRQAITVTGSGGKALATRADLTVAVNAVDYDFEVLDAVDISAGDSVEFAMTNNGEVEHEFEVFGPDGEVLGEVGPTDPGQDGTVILDLEAAGTYRFVCGIDDHEQLGMVGTFTVG